MADSKRSIVPGVLLIMIGLWFLTREYFYDTSYWEKSYPIILILFAAFLIWDAIRRNHSSALFWGVVLISLGTFFLARNYNLIPYFYSDEYWPIFLLAMGFGFVSLFVFQPRDWGVLIPAAIFLFFGFGFSFENFRGYFWDYEHFVENYWPIIIIFIGIGVILSGIMKTTHKD